MQAWEGNPDELNRDITCTDTGSDTTSTAYDLGGNVITETDAKSNDTTHTYDARGRRLTTTDRLLAVTTRAWAAGNAPVNLATFT